MFARVELVMSIVSFLPFLYGNVSFSYANVSLLCLFWASLPARSQISSELELRTQRIPLMLLFHNPLQATEY